MKYQEENKKEKKDKTTKNKEESSNVVRRRPRTRSQSEDVSEEIKKITSEENKSELEEQGDFDKFDISKKAVKKLKANGINYLFPVQTTTYKAIYDGNDVIVQARTGTGKTLGFGLPVLERMNETADEILNVKRRVPVFLTLAPTRELAIQIQKEFEKFKSSKLNLSCFYGGAPYFEQERQMRNGIDVLVGTPGRILDFIQKGTLDVSKLKYVVLDEADRMMDFGFQESLDEILSHAYTDGNKPQTLLFSATVPPWLKKTSKKYMSDEVKVFDLIGDQRNKSSTTVEHKAIKCSHFERPSTIKDVIQVYSGKHGKTIVFTTTKNEANELAISSVLNMSSQVLHGDIPQARREITLQNFREGKFNCLVATDVAARGLDIPEIDLVVQTEPPKDVESYIHRSGRTGRAGRNGVCIVFYKPGQEYGIEAVERRAGISFKRIGPPQQADLLKSNVDDAVRCLDEVKGNVLDIFLPAAKELIEKRGAEDALAAALAFISGTKEEIVQRSLLCSLPNFTTYIMKQNWELRSNSLIYSILRRHFSPEFVDKIRGMRMLKDKLNVQHVMVIHDQGHIKFKYKGCPSFSYPKGAVFDVPSDEVKTIEEQWKGDKHATLEQLQELPELLEGVSTNPNYSNNRSGGNSGRGSYGNRGGRGGGRGGGYKWSNNNNRFGGGNKRPGNFDNGFSKNKRLRTS